MHMIRDRISTLLALLIVGCLSSAALAAAEPAAMPNPFFAYCVGIGTTKEAAALPAQMAMAPILADLGYAGMAYVGVGGAVNVLDALEKHHQKLIAVYAGVNVDPAAEGQAAYDPRLKEILPKIAGHGTLVWLVLNSKKYKPSSSDGDEHAVMILREIADAAKPYGIHVSLYPHMGAYAQRMEDVVRLAEKVQRSNVGVTFTFCHFLAVDKAENLDHVLALARPYLNLVTINGTDGFNQKNHAGWIRILDEGSFDVSTVLVALRKIDYRGPIGMIAFGIKGDVRDVLDHSIRGWRAVAAKAVGASPAPNR